jgi:hypothetical protein
MFKEKAYLRVYLPEWRDHSPVSNLTLHNLADFAALLGPLLCATHQLGVSTLTP